jgi:hypothetical protein
MYALVMYDFTLDKYYDVLYSILTRASKPLDIKKDNLEDYNTYINLDTNLQKDYILNDIRNKYPNKNDYLRHISKKIAYYGGRRRRSLKRQRRRNN